MAGGRGGEGSWWGSGRRGGGEGSWRGVGEERSHGGGRGGEGRGGVM